MRGILFELYKYTVFAMLFEHGEHTRKQDCQKNSQHSACVEPCAKYHWRKSMEGLDVSIRIRKKRRHASGFWVFKWKLNRCIS